MDAVAGVVMAGAAVVDTGPMDGAEAERLAGVEEVALRDSGSRAVVNNERRNATEVQRQPRYPTQARLVTPR